MSVIIPSFSHIFLNLFKAFSKLSSSFTITTAIQVQTSLNLDLSDEEIIQVIQKYAKQRKESIKQYRDAGREDLAQKEEKELEIVSKFLP
ncbi:MAG: hypothetical protein DSY47_06615, partial [Hydrogenothermus sp.]